MYGHIESPSVTSTSLPDLVWLTDLCEVQGIHSGLHGLWSATTVRWLIIGQIYITHGLIMY